MNNGKQRFKVQLSPQPGSKISHTQPRMNLPKVVNLKIHNYDKENGDGIIKEYKQPPRQERAKKAGGEVRAVRNVF